MMTTEKTDATSQPGEVRSSEGLGRTLLPCPFCGKAHTLTLTTARELAEQDADYDGEFWEHSDSWAVMCDAHRPGGPGGCGASGGFFPTEAKAVEAWNKRPDVVRWFGFEFEVWQGDEMQASATGPRETALREAMHYAAQYGQDGPVRVFEVTRVLVSP